MRHVGGVPSRQEFQDRFLGREQSLRRKVIDLSTARTDERLNLPGVFLYCDKDSTGAAYLKLDAADAPPMPVGANFGLEIPFSQLYLTNAAQAGKVLNLWYGFDARVIPPNQDISSIGRVDAVTVIDAVTPRTIGASDYVGVSAVNTTLTTILAPASNAAGVTIHGAWGAVSAGYLRIMSKASAPVSWADSAARTIVLAGWAYPFAQPGLPIFLPAGQGIYAQTGAGTAEYCALNYTIH